MGAKQSKKQDAVIKPVDNQIITPVRRSEAQVQDSANQQSHVRGNSDINLGSSPHQR